MSTSHPSNVLRSSGVPSPLSFLSLIESFRGSGSVAFGGRNIVWIASGAAFCALSTQSPVLPTMIIRSSMYPSTAACVEGTGTNSGRGCPKGVSFPCRDAGQSSFPLKSE